MQTLSPPPTLQSLSHIPAHTLSGLPSLDLMDAVVNVPQVPEISKPRPGDMVEEKFQKTIKFVFKIILFEQISTNLAELS